MVQELGETREAMARGLMTKIEKVINDEKTDHFWIFVHAKPMHYDHKQIKQVIVTSPVEPPMMLASLCFEVDKRNGVLKLLWALPGDWPTYTVGGTVKPIPEVVASYDKLEKKISYDINSFIEKGMDPAVKNSESTYTAI